MSTLKTLFSEGVQSGDLVHITLISEAYTSAQMSEFFEDVNRLVEEAFVSDDAAFKSLLPLLAVHAIHVPSDQDHIPLAYGRNRALIRQGKASTAFDLRREDGPLRTIAPRNYRVAYSKAKKICKKMAPGCDHIMLLVRDKYYGGLGDEVAIFTSSLTSGTLALRHELGHILADVGEEYDGGSDYSGPNFSESTRICGAEEKPRSVKTYDGIREVWPCISWGGWLSPNTTVGSTNEVVSEPMQLSLAEWPFVDLSKKGSVSFPLDVKSDMQGTRVLLSVAGIRSNGAQGVTKEGQVARFEVDIDGHKEIVPLPRSFDRSFFSFAGPPLSPSSQPKLTVSMITSGAPQRHDRDEATPPPMVCHVQVHQYQSAVPARSHTVGAFPVFGEKKTAVGYRPTLDGCAMRRMQSTCFCPVCLEQLWRRVLPRSGLLRSSKGAQVSFDSDASTLSVTPAPLSHGGDGLEIKWLTSTLVGEDDVGEGSVLQLGEFSVPRCFKVRARFRSDRIRREPRVLQEELAVLVAANTHISDLTDLPHLLRMSPREQAANITALAKQCLSHKQRSHHTSWIRSPAPEPIRTTADIQSHNTHHLFEYDPISPLGEPTAHETLDHRMHSLVLSISFLLFLVVLLFKRCWCRCCSFTKLRVS